MLKFVQNKTLSLNCSTHQAPDEVSAGGRGPMLDLLEETVMQALPELGFDPLQDVQVLSAMHRGPFGTLALNKV